MFSTGYLQTFMLEQVTTPSNNGRNYCELTFIILSKYAYLYDAPTIPGKALSWLNRLTLFSSEALV